MYVSFRVPYIIALYEWHVDLFYRYFLINLFFFNLTFFKSWQNTKSISSSFGNTVFAWFIVICLTDYYFVILLYTYAFVWRVLYFCCIISSLCNIRHISKTINCWILAYNESMIRQRAVKSQFQQKYKLCFPMHACWMSILRIMESEDNL